MPTRRPGRPKRPKRPKQTSETSETSEDVCQQKSVKYLRVAATSTDINGYSTERKTKDVLVNDADMMCVHDFC